MTPTFFAKQSDFRNWLEKNHKKETELLVGFYKVDSGKKMDRKEQRTANSTFAIGGVFPLGRDRLCSADSFVVTESSVLRMNICAKKPAHRKSAKRQAMIKTTGFSK